MAEVEYDPTDQGVSWVPSDEDVARMADARRRGLTAADVPHGPPASAATRARVIAQFATRHGSSSRRLSRRVHGSCSRCGAEPGQWCRRTVRTDRQLGFVHPEREATPD